MYGVDVEGTIWGPQRALTALVPHLRSSSNIETIQFKGHYGGSDASSRCDSARTSDRSSLRTIERSVPSRPRLSAFFSRRLSLLAAKIVKHPAAVTFRVPQEASGMPPKYKVLSPSSAILLAF